ncbi:LapD/MoxY N-terminal periplasmic domain-containing protein [Rhodovulum sp. BSW8]|uniref:sensor histidine kinase n=1 Tax=Rhodovulum sp. BSW8 TaxID=2259645 RepID=UPI001FB39992|nr:LapD/MoxY N-terminal periplasmic domain-containing protein [Rhodovulum sp. BSW8]
MPAVSILAAAALCVGVAGALILNARQAVREETGSAFELARAAAVLRLPSGYGGGDPVDQARELAEEIDARRHVAATFEEISGQAAVRTEGSRASDGTAPRWFAALMRPPGHSDRFLVARYPNVLGALTVTTDPSDEIAEVWEDFRILLPILACTGFGMGLLSVGLTRFVLRQLEAVLVAIGEMRAGRLELRAPEGPLSELAALAEGVNALASHLQTERRENALLQSRLMTMAEAERARIASDLHDEMGPELFALNAAAGEVEHHLGAVPEAFAAPLRDAVGAVMRHTAAVQKSARAAINDLRPMIAGEATLFDLLADLAAGFNDTAPGTEFVLSADPEARADEMAELSIYRFVRESVLNSLRHGQPSRVEIGLWREKRALTARVADNGTGLREASPDPGLGIAGMRDRALALGAEYLPPARLEGWTVTELRMPVS